LNFVTAILDKLKKKHAFVPSEIFCSVQNHKTTQQTILYPNSTFIKKQTQRVSIIIQICNTLLIDCGFILCYRAIFLYAPETAYRFGNKYRAVNKFWEQRIKILFCSNGNVSAALSLHNKSTTLFVLGKPLSGKILYIFFILKYALGKRIDKIECNKYSLSVRKRFFSLLFYTSIQRLPWLRKNSGCVLSPLLLII
jgi:hypothetical protein